MYLLKKEVLLLIALVLFPLQGIFSQNGEFEISGHVSDEKGEPIIGANVVVQGTATGGITDIDGNFRFKVSDKNGILVISYIGYLEQSMSMNGKNSFNVTLKEDSETLEEVVVVGYGVQKKSVVTGAISSIKAEDMTTSITNAQQALQGKTSGVQVISASGSPGADMKIRIRGYSSNGKSDPLYIVDGLRTESISSLDPNNIASMEVLKDAASAAIYGAEGGNGVVLITTKTGTQGITKVTYDFQYSIQSATHLPELMNAEQYIGYQTEAGNLPQATTSMYDTDWLKEVFESSPMQKHNLSISGSNDKSTYYVSLGYLNHNGIVTGDQDKYQRISGMFNGSYKVKSWLKIGSNLSLGYSKRNSISENNIENSVVGNALVLDPLTPVEYAGTLPSNITDLLNGKKKLLQSENNNYYGISDYVTGNVNPFVRLASSQNRYVQNSVMGNIYADITPIDGLTITSKLVLIMTMEY